MGFLPGSRRITQNIKEFVSGPLFDPGEPPESNTAWPRISIITPSFNQASFLERTILSIHNQGYPNLEHIIIDGGSTDGSIEIIKKYESRLAYWQSTPDEGQSDAINTGARRATGSHMTWINSDDMLLPGALSMYAGALENDPDTQLIYGDQVEIDSEDRVVKRVLAVDFDIRDFIYEINIIIHQQSAIWSVDLFKQLGGLKPYRYAMDYELFYRMCKTGARFQRIAGFLSAFRVHAEGLTGSGELGRLRGEEINTVFKDYTGRERTHWDNLAARPTYKIRRLVRHPRTLLAAAEHRLGQVFWKRTV